MSIFKSILKFFGIGNSSSELLNNEVPRDDYAYNELRAKKQQEMDRILDKIGDKGMESLSAKEKEFLDNQSQNS